MDVERRTEMRIVLNIPQDFELDYIDNKFSDFFKRAEADMSFLCGNYEKETAEMFVEAF